MVDNYDLTSLQDVVVGAAPMSHDLEMLVAERLKGVKNVRQGVL